MDPLKNELDYLEPSKKLYGRDKEAEEIIYRISSSNMLVIEGKSGTGKTALLKHAIKNFRGRKKVIYVDVGTFGRRFDIGKILNKKQKAMILLIDNIQYLSEENSKKIKYFYDQDYLKSVVFTTTDYNSVNFTEAIRSRVGRNIIKLRKLNKKNSMTIANSRIPEDSIPEKVLDKLYEESNNIKDFLLRCNCLCKYLVETNKDVATIKDIGKISLDMSERNQDICLECNSPLVEINGRWRCETCDNFCHKCGTLYARKEKSCPNCGMDISKEEVEEDA